MAECCNILLRFECEKCTHHLLLIVNPQKRLSEDLNLKEHQSFSGRCLGSGCNQVLFVLAKVFLSSATNY
jgi:hypothetical protein